MSHNLYVNSIRDVPIPWKQFNLENPHIFANYTFSAAATTGNATS